MSNKDPQPHHRPNPSGPLADMKSIPVAIMQFREMVEIPGRLASQGLKAEVEPGNRKRWRISYLPQLRHFQLDFFPANAGAPECSYLIHETLVVWWIAA